ncbi:hypothetical protein GCM10010168_42250 [Actinoplanes ianthinogenes]|uniref:Uncharacterized protein n=1 Tax=Actinoplanes ianthinogenes TaxID=122358 RepID=A0ABN6CD44_9ACTN|nr:hypothetical protein [Actinoplanes ianthinogenes]BCJ43465.1 hypothetical protein Aiant_41220 [Actinoplanes ianthinogenes]GGR19919.1 hypothetical protein GCM10010168_42250 [Actinoplanes ianthinogenes]
MFDINRRRAGGTGAFRRWAVPVSVAAIVMAAGGGAIAKAAHAAESGGRGPNEYGMTMGSHAGHSSSFTYTHGFYCDTHVAAASTTGCEAGEAAEVAPAKHVDPLFITVPLGFTAKGLDCPDKLTCVDHPMNLDMTRLAAALAPVYKTTPEKLTPALRNFTTPGHDHFIGTKAEGKAEWWDVRVVGVTDPATYRAVQQHRSWTYLHGLIKAKNKHVVGPIPTNMFLFFAAR